MTASSLLKRVYHVTFVISAMLMLATQAAGK